jgi:hypothetical protein
MEVDPLPPMPAVVTEFLYVLTGLNKKPVEHHMIPVVLSVDASPTEIGAVLLQEGQPVTYSSISLTPTQQRYCQIEKKLLVVQFGLLRFR